MEKRIIERWIVLVAGIIAETFQNLEDGKINFAEGLGYTNDLFPMIRNIMDVPLVPDELKMMIEDPNAREQYTNEIVIEVSKKLSKIKKLDINHRKKTILSIVEKSLGAFIYNSAFVAGLVDDIRTMKVT